MHQKSSTYKIGLGTAASGLLLIVSTYTGAQFEIKGIENSRPKEARYYAASLDHAQLRQLRWDILDIIYIDNLMQKALTILQGFNRQKMLESMRESYDEDKDKTPEMIPDSNIYSSIG